MIIRFMISLTTGIPSHEFHQQNVCAEIGRPVWHEVQQPRPGQAGIRLGAPRIHAFTPVQFMIYYGEEVLQGGLAHMQ